MSFTFTEMRSSTIQFHSHSFRFAEFTVFGPKIFHLACPCRNMASSSDSDLIGGNTVNSPAVSDVALDKSHNSASDSDVHVETPVKSDTDSDAIGGGKTTQPKPPKKRRSRAKAAATGDEEVDVGEGGSVLVAIVACPKDRKRWSSTPLVDSLEALGCVGYGGAAGLPCGFCLLRWQFLSTDVQNDEAFWPIALRVEIKPPSTCRMG